MVIHISTQKNLRHYQVDEAEIEYTAAHDYDPIVFIVDNIPCMHLFAHHTCFGARQIIIPLMEPVNPKTKHKFGFQRVLRCHWVRKSHKYVLHTGNGCETDQNVEITLCT